MSLPATIAAFTPAVDLLQWSDALKADRRWELILRNFDRECDRDDIDRGRLEQFLRDIESEWNVLSTKSGLVSPTKAIDNVMARNWQRFRSPGKILTESRRTILCRYMRLDHLWQHNLKHLPISGQSSMLAQEINSANVTGSDVSGFIGASSRPGWCTKDSTLASLTDANRIRDLVGLKHIEGDWILELKFSMSFLHSQNIDLQAPTVIDSVAGGAENWIFSKRRDPGGPDWGITVDMQNGGACAPGIAEAVHSQFDGAPRQGSSIQLRAVGEVTASAPSVDYSALLGNPAI